MNSKSDHLQSVSYVVSQEEIRAELARILSSRVFLHSRRIRKFVQFVVERSLAERKEDLKEYLIGLEVFGRQESFDPRVDSIVRVEARRLRSKLDEFYSSEGSSNTVRIRIPKGSYVPEFLRKIADPTAPGNMPAPAGGLLIVRPLSTDLPGAIPRDAIEDVERRLLYAAARSGDFQIWRTLESTTDDYAGGVLTSAVRSTDNGNLLALQLTRHGVITWQTEFPISPDRCEGLERLTEKLTFHVPAKSEFPDLAAAALPA